MRNKTSKSILFTGLLAVLILHGCGGGGGGGSGGGQTLPTATVAVSPSSGVVNKGDTFSRTVEVQNVGNTYFIAFDMTYDPAVIAYTDAEEGTFLSRNQPDSTNFQSALENGTQGRVVFGLTRLGGGGVSGNGTLLTLHFKAVGSGKSSISFSSPKGFKNNSGSGQDVSINSWEDGTITVQ